MTSITAPRPARADRPAPAGRFLPASAEGRLRAVLVANAATSLAAGTAAVVAPRWTADLLGVATTGWVRAVGVALVVFAVDVALVARARRATLRTGAAAVSAADLAWVAATVVLVTAGAFDTTGRAVAAVMGVGVLDFALLQLRYRRSSG